MGPEKQQHVPSLELVEFVRPYTSDKILYVSKISSQLSEGEVYFRLCKAFEPYGLINDVHVVKPSVRLQTATEGQQEERSYYYAFVKFYLARDAAKARAGLNGKYLIGRQPILVQHATKMKKREPSPLPFSKCLDLANHFLGFDGWSSHVVSFGQDPESPQHDPNSLRYICVMKIEIRGWDLSCGGVGLGEKTIDPTRPEERVSLIGAAMKTAVNRALQNAFQKVILIVMDNKKVAVEINNTVPDGIPNSTEGEAHMVPVSVQDGGTGEEDDMELLLAQMESY
ncbi:PREDICTED: RAD52 motif-containing protein 1-like [Branchiostoma belcheri]|uniref:RAD52 motif-containing protein 1-like n=1 Tax=Branchiostoma belcheri TaxID=7741 RepID=A0A6P4Z7R7_BRABE|nr:PREDICTED: RAD52 motif-containing protein 1-like [Branchiostoma belcheri]